MSSVLEDNFYSLTKNKMVVIILTLIAVSFFWGFLCYLGYLCWEYNSDNQCEDEIIELKKELTRWKKQHTQAITEIHLLRTQILNCQTVVRTRAEQDKEQITELYKSWKTNKQIAEELHTSISTIQRATRKRWLSEQYWKGRRWRKKNVGM